MTDQLHRPRHPVERLETATHLAEPVVTDAIEARARLLARAWSIVALAVFGVVALRYGTPQAPDYEPWQTTASLAALGVVAAGLLAARRWEGLGGSVALTAAVALGVLAAVEYRPWVAFGVAVVFVVPAVLFLVAWQRTRTLLSVVVLVAVLIAVMTAGGVAAFAFYQRGFGPSHPGSTLAPLPDSPVEWIWSGGVTTDSAVVVAAVPAVDAVRLAVATDPAWRDARMLTAVAASGPVHRFVVSGLEPGRRYHYAVEADGVLDEVRRGTFATFPAGPDSLRIAFGSCARRGSNGAVFDAIRESAPDLYLVVGDLFYGDVYENSVDRFRSLFDTTLTEPAQAALFREVPIAYVWDDHDYGPNDAASDSPSREAAQAAYREIVPHYPVSGEDGSIGQAFTVGRVRVILTDLRSGRTPSSMPDGPAKSMLGAVQYAWLETELLESSGRYPVVVWVSSVPWIVPVTAGADDWGGYAVERAAIATFLAAHDIDNVLMLAGDAHMIAIDDGSHAGYGPDGEGGFPVFHAGALDRVGSEKGGPYSEGVVAGGGHFGLVDVRDDGGDLVTVTLSGRDWTGREVMGLTLRYDASGGGP